jgi:hypothetical protein
VRDGLSPTALSMAFLFELPVSGADGDRRGGQDALWAGAEPVSPAPATAMTPRPGTGFATAVRPTPVVVAADGVPVPTKLTVLPRRW